MKSNDFFIEHMEDLALKAARTGCVTSKFLTSAEAQKTATHFMRNNDISLSFDGGYSGAERVRAVFLNPEWGECGRESLFAVLTIAFRQQDSLGHRGYSWHADGVGH